MEPFYALIPPWAALSAVIGTMHGALFHLFFGSHVSRLPGAVVIALTASLIGGLIGTMIPPAIVSIGDTNLISTAVTVWLALGAARFMGLV